MARFPIRRPARPGTSTTGHSGIIGNVLGAALGRHFATRNPVAGAVVGAAIPWIARRGLGPLGLALGAGWMVKNYLERKQRQPADADRIGSAPSLPVADHSPAAPVKPAPVRR